MGSVEVNGQSLGPRGAVVATCVLAAAMGCATAPAPNRPATSAGSGVAAPRRGGGPPELHPQVAALRAPLSEAEKRDCAPLWDAAGLTKVRTGTVALNLYKQAWALQTRGAHDACARRVRCALGLEPPPRIEAKLLSTQARSFEVQGKYGTAEPLYQRSLRIREAKLSPDHPDVATALHNLAGLYQAQGRYGAAAALSQRALRIREAKLGPDHPDVATSLGSLASLYQAQGRYGAAAPLYQRSLRIREATLGPDHPDVALSLNNLALLYEAQGRYGAAAPLYQRSLRIREATLGPDHPDVAQSLSNLALLYHALGQYEAAAPLYQRSLRILEAALGPDHPNGATVLNNLASLYASQGRYGAAEPLLQRSLRIREATLGPDHPDVAVAVNNLAWLYQAQGRYGTAAPLYQRSLRIREAKLGPDHPDVAGLLNSFAHLDQAQARYGAAAPLYQRSLRIKEATLGPDHPRVATALNNLASLYISQGRYGAAEPLLQRSLRICEAKLGPDHPDVALSLGNLASLYQAQGRYGSAAPLLQRSLRICEAKLGPDNPDVATSLNNLASLYISQGRYGTAAPLYQRALRIREAKLGPDHPDVALSLHDLALLYEFQGRYGAAEPLYQRSLRILEARLGPDHPDVATVLDSLAGLHKSQGKYGAASPLYQRALRIQFTRGLVPRQYGVSDSYARYLRSTKHPDAAIFWGKRAVNLLQGLRAGMKDLEASTQAAFLASKRGTYERLAEWLVEDGRIAEAEQVLRMLKEHEAFEFVRREATDDPRKDRADYSAVEADVLKDFESTSVEYVGVAEALDRLLAQKRKRLKTGAKVDDLKPKIAALRARYHAYEEAFDKVLKASLDTFEETAARPKPKALDDDTVETVRGTLEATGAVLVWFLVAPEKIHAVVLGPDVRVPVTTAVKREELNRRVRALREALKDPSVDPRPAAAALYKVTFGPLRPVLGRMKPTTVAVSADGALRYVPLAALYDPSSKRYLVEDFAVVRYSPAALSVLERPADPGAWSAAGLGLTQKVEGFSRLPGVKAELEALVRGADTPKGILPGQLKLDGAFDEDALIDALDLKRPVVHIASHFKLNPGDHTQSFLLLGTGERLSIAQMDKRRFKFRHVEMMTLSACETAVGTPARGKVGGEELDSFATLAQRRGAQSILASLWPVSDDATAQFMAGLYRRKVQDGLSKAQALRQTQLEFLRAKANREATDQRTGIPGQKRFDGAKLSHPYHWAPFVLFGNWQ